VHVASPYVPSPSSRLRWSRRAKGQALAEFAITVPIVLLLAAITIDFARVYYFDLSIRDASFAAARYAGMNPFDDPGIKNAAVNAAPNGVLTTARVSISTPTNTTCNGSVRISGCPMTITVTYSFTPITPIISSFVGNIITLTRSQTDIVK
jgi:Flp pilus assembly protein TadG